MSGTAPTRSSWRPAFALVVVAVVLAHLLATEWLADALPDLKAPPPPPRMVAAFVRELQPSEPPVAAPRAPPRQRRAAPRPATPASALQAEAAASRAAEPEPRAAEAPVATSDALAEMASGAADAPARAASDTAAADVGAAPAQPPASAPAFEWPPSTRLSYTLSGHVRGEVHGTAQVRWIRDGARYQVQLDVVVGPGFAPLLQRHMTSDGELTELGLRPQRYDEQTQIAFGGSRRATLGFEADTVTLANGRRVPTLPQVQDTASQFVQLTWLFLTDPQRLRAGAAIEVPLALPRRVDRWVYDVLGQETVYTPFGAVPAWHLLPRRAGSPSTLSIEAWFAPSLQYLPVRIVIRQDDENFIDLTVERLPEQAAPPR